MVNCSLRITQVARYRNGTLIFHSGVKGLAGKKLTQIEAKAVLPVLLRKVGKKAEKREFTQAMIIGRC